MANEGRISISDGSTSFNIEPALLLEVEHREDFSYRDINGQVRARDLSTYGKLTQLTIEIPLGAVTRAKRPSSNSNIARGCGVVMSNKRKATKYS